MKTMKAAVLLKNGDPTRDDVLCVKDDVEVPADLGKDEILIKVSAAAINPVDYMLMKGDFPGLKKGLTGCDVSGIVEAIGPSSAAGGAKDAGVNAPTDLKVGDEVYADTMGNLGSFAEYVRVKKITASRKPSNINMIQAAALPLVGLTALQGLVTHGGLKEGVSVCILGGSGGVGSLAVQMAKALGASKVWATGTSVDMIKGFGADKVINYKDESVVEALNGQNFDIIYDTVGGLEGWNAAKSGLKKGGTFVTIVGDGGSMPYLIGTIVWRKFKSVLGLCHSYKFFMCDNSSPAVVEDMKKITELVESGKVKPVLDERTFELTTKSVHEMVEASMGHRAKGKLILKVNC
jgi:NADPH:quinone reductase-like Zn-dependent oxidoreductase